MSEFDLETVIVTYNCADFVRPCLVSLPAACDSLKWRCWVVDNASIDDSAAAAREALPEVTLIQNPSNAGFAKANNLALKQANGRYLLLLNPDTEAPPGSLLSLVRFMDEHPGAGACGPMLLNSDGSVQPNGRRFPTLWRELLAVTGLRRLCRRYFESTLEYGRDDFATAAQVDYVMGACLMVRADSARQVGFLDESYFMFYEEVDWCHRLKRAGWEIWYVPASRVVHHWMGSVRLAPKRMTRAYYRSQLRYFWSTSGVPGVAGAILIAFTGLLKNEIVHLGSAAKRSLRRAGILRPSPDDTATST